MAKPGRFDWLFRPQLADEDRPLSAELRFAEALAELPAVERSALALSEIGGLDTDEIAERLGTDSATVRKLLARAREAVRTSLAVRGRGLTALLPFQSLWQLGSSAPALRAVGAVAAATAVVGPSILVGRTAAEAQPVMSAAPDSLRVRVRALERPDVDRIAPARAHVSLAVAPAAAPPSAKPQEADAEVERRPIPLVAAPTPEAPSRVEPEPAGEQAASPPVPPPAAQPVAVAEVPMPVTAAATVLPPPPVELPAVLPVPDPALVPVPAAPPLPPLPLPVPPPLPLP